jgi:ABC-type glycerol-3-phosphate transport system substrate-binding protein
MASGTYDKAAASIVDSFKASSGIDVTVSAFPWAVLRQNNTTDLLTGTGTYDVMSGSYYLADVYSNFISLDEYIAKYNFGKDFIPGLMGKCEFFGGHQIGLPYGPDVFGFMYRKDLFDKVGIKWPSTWNEFIKLLPQLKKLAEANGMDTLVFPAGQPDQMPALFVDKYDGTFITKDKKFQLDPPKAIAALEMAKTLVSYMPANRMSMSFDDANARFVNGKALMCFDWPSFVVATADDPAKSKVVGKWALGKCFTPGRPWLSLWQVYISKYSKNPEAAFKWIMALINPKTDMDFYKVYGLGPVFNSSYADPDIVKNHNYQFAAQKYNLGIAANPSMSGEAQDYFSSSMGEFLIDKITAKQFVDQVNAKWATLTVPVGLLDTAAKTGQMAK